MPSCSCFSSCSCGCLTWLYNRCSGQNTGVNTPIQNSKSASSNQKIDIQNLTGEGMASTGAVDKLRSDQTLSNEKPNPETRLIPRSSSTSFAGAAITPGGISVSLVSVARQNPPTVSVLYDEPFNRPGISPENNRLVDKHISNNSGSALQTSDSQSSLSITIQPSTRGLSSNTSMNQHLSPPSQKGRFRHSLSSSSSTAFSVASDCSLSTTPSSTYPTHSSGKNTTIFSFIARSHPNTNATGNGNSVGTLASVNNMQSSHTATAASSSNPENLNDNSASLPGSVPADRGPFQSPHASPNATIRMLNNRLSNINSDSKYAMGKEELDGTATAFEITGFTNAATASALSATATASVATTSSLPELMSNHSSIKLRIEETTRNLMMATIASTMTSTNFTATNTADTSTISHSHSPHTRSTIASFHAASGSSTPPNRTHTPIKRGTAANTTANTQTPRKPMAVLNLYDALASPASTSTSACASASTLGKEKQYH